MFQNFMFTRQINMVLFLFRLFFKSNKLIKVNSSKPLKSNYKLKKIVVI